MIRQKEVSITLAIHGVVIALLFFFGLSTPLPSLDGMMSLRFDFSASSESPATTQIQYASLATTAVSERVATQNVEKSIPVRTSSNRKEHVERSSLYEASTVSVEEVTPVFTNNASAGNDGTATDDGDSPISVKMSGRSLLSINSIRKDYTETGKVVMHIKVDRNGKVLSARFVPKGSTTSSPKLIRLAEEIALEARFSENHKVEEQFGTMTFAFNLK